MASLDQEANAGIGGRELGGDVARRQENAELVLQGKHCPSDFVVPDLAC